ncbi:hypothetical protein [Frankia nepalensis]|uniref:hypothetical protein n=1 Tax=Frankia nepalensis TaxID=1836974 RepID=UPI001EE4C1FC|nr:hypothetical protein [Frankia nepalensis]
MLADSEFLEDINAVGGLLTVLVLCVAAGFLFYFMSGSFKRLRGNVARGEFGAADTRRRADSAVGSTVSSTATAKAAETPAVPAVPRQSDGSADADPKA